MDALLYPFRHKADVEAKVGFLSWPRQCYASATSELVHAKNPNPLKLSFSIEVWDNSLTCTLDPSLVIIILCESAIHMPVHASSLSHAVHQLSIADDDVTYVHLEPITRSECIIWSNIFYLFSVLFIVECWYNAVFVYNVPFLPWVIWYNRRLRFNIVQQM